MRLQNADNKWIAVCVSFKTRALSEYTNILDSFMSEIRVLRCAIFLANTELALIVILGYEPCYEEL